MSLGYSNPIKRAARRILGLKPCPCGCNNVATRQAPYVDWSKLSRIGKWATIDPDGD